MNGEVQEVVATVTEAAKSTVKAAEASGGGQTGLIIAAVAVGYLFFAIVLWKLFQKAGVAPWKALIPGLNIICLFQIMSDTDSCWGMILTGVLVLFLWYIVPVPVPKPSDPRAVQALVKTLLLFAGIEICFGFHIFNSWSGAPRFDKSEAFSVGLILLPFIFYPILAFDKSKYHVY